MNHQHILVVDDELEILDTIRIVLEDANYKVTICNNPIEALSMVKNSPDLYNLLISDLTMPEMNGEELVSKINNVNINLPVIIISGYSQEDINEINNRLVIRKFLSKPVTIDKLLSSIEEIFR